MTGKFAYPIISGTVGSKAHGTATPNSDTDILTVEIEPLTSHFKYNQEYGNTQTIIDGVDTVTYGLKQFTYLAANSQPSLIQLLFLKNYQTLTEEGGRLLQNRDLFISKDLGRRFYFYGLNVKNTYTCKDSNPKLAYTSYKVLTMGLELMNSHTLSLPASKEVIELCHKIRKEEISPEKIQNILEELAAQLQASIKNSDLPAFPDKTKVEKLKNSIYTDYYFKHTHFLQ